MKSSNTKYDSSSPKRARIAIVGPVPPPYHGVTIMTENILRSEVRERFELIHVDTSDHRAVENVGRVDLTNLCLGLFHILKFFYLLWTKKPRAVYIPISQAAWGYLRDSVFIVLGLILRKRIIVHLHGGEFDRFYQRTSFMMKMIIRFSLPKVSRVIVLGESLKRLFYEFVSPQIVEAVPNGIADIAEDLKDVRERTPNDKVLVAFLGNFIRSKGVIELIKTIPLVLKENDNVNFVFAGSWYQENTKEAALQLLDTNGLWDHVRFVGRVLGEQKASLLMTSDIFVFPPVGPEGQPLVLLEAMSAGLPIVTTDQGCIAETVIHGLNGFIVESSNLQQLASRILQLAADAGLRESMGRKSRERFMQFYTRDMFAQNISNVFARVVGIMTRTLDE